VSLESDVLDEIIEFQISSTLFALERRRARRRFALRCCKKKNFNIKPMELELSLPREKERRKSIKLN
jgi:hypothetical protein